MPVLRYFSSISQPTTLSGSISAGATSIPVAAVTGFPPTTPYTLALDYGASAEELVDVTAVAGTTLTVTRAVDGTAAQSHSLGAVVRHVASGRDFADYQTHQAATTAVHGVAGTLVGTSDSQTLSNKTLTSPTVNSATVTGTVAAGTTAFTGNPTFSGNPAFTGAPTFTPTAGVLFTRSAATDIAIKTRVSGDANDRLQAQADGKLLWGDGTSVDTNLYRSSANVLETDDTFQIGAAGTLLLGSGGDVNLYRSGANALATDDAFTGGTTITSVGNTIVGGDLKLVNGATTYRNALVAAATTVANTATETVVGTFTIPANDAVVGATYRLRMVANVSFLASAGLNWRARLGGLAGTLLANAGPTTLSGTGQTNKESVVETDLICVSTGAAGTWFAMLHEVRNTTQTGSVGESQLGSSDGTLTVDTTASQAFVITAQWSAASASNTLTARCTFERVA